MSADYRKRFRDLSGLEVCDLSRHRVARDDLAVEVRAQLWYSFLYREIHIVYASSFIG
jgi:hypothetical protein